MSTRLSCTAVASARRYADPVAAPVGRPARSANTRRAYDSDWARFVTWCADHRHRPLPASPLVVAAYVRDAAKARDAHGESVYAAATLRRWLAAIAERHRMSRHPSPTTDGAVRQALSAITRVEAAARPPRSAAPLLTADVAAMIAAARKDT